ncbi:hypothetical protein WA026_008346 [Henosepilachna vigintioctopunctata]|uniref:Uncharacterized protein n=1 Tax=Henosepilachna vigintioctopunctata TaxID=420089 RepID=A0AAW1UI46_9CUCU
MGNPNQIYPVTQSASSRNCHRVILLFTHDSIQNALKQIVGRRNGIWENGRGRYGTSYASFGKDLCPLSSQWLIVEVFTATARMEQLLIAQLQITVMFLSDASSGCA